MTTNKNNILKQVITEFVLPSDQFNKLESFHLVDPY